MQVKASHMAATSPPSPLASQGIVGPASLDLPNDILTKATADQAVLRVLRLGDVSLPVMDRAKCIRLEMFGSYVVSKPFRK
jgi:hypothetical protein